MSENVKEKYWSALMKIEISVKKKKEKVSLFRSRNVNCKFEEDDQMILKSW